MAGSLHRESGDLSRDGDRQCLQAPHLGHQASPTSLNRRIGLAICEHARCAGCGHTTPSPSRGQEPISVDRLGAEPLSIRESTMI